MAYISSTSAAAANLQRSSANAIFYMLDIFVPSMRSWDVDEVDENRYYREDPTLLHICATRPRLLAWWPSEYMHLYCIVLYLCSLKFNDSGREINTKIKIKRELGVLKNLEEEN